MADGLDLDTVATVVASNLVAPAGVLVLDWSVAVLLGVFVAETAVLFGWALVKIPFAAKRSRGAVKRSRVAWLFHQLRGSVSMPGPIPPVYPRNVPPLFVGPVFAAIAVGIAFTLFALVAAPSMTQADGTGIVLGGLTVLLFRSAESVVEYFVHGGYRRHSTQSVFAEPLTGAIGLCVLFAAAVAVDAAGIGVERSAAALALLAGGKTLLDLRGLRIEADDDRHGILGRLFGSTATAVDPEPIDEPSGDPRSTHRPPRTAAVADAVLRGIVYAGTSLVTFFAAIAAIVAGLVAGPLAGVGAAAALLIPFVAARALARYLTYGAVEYRCYDGLLVVHSPLLGAGQARLRRQAVDGVTIGRDLVDRTFDTGTLDLEADGPDTAPEVGLPDPDDDPDDVNEDRPRTLAHLGDPDAVIDALGVRWLLERDG